jgi:hypothetical protein
VFGSPGLALRKYRWVLDQPQFIRCARVTLVCKRLHGAPDRFVIHQTQAPDEQV